MLLMLNFVKLAILGYIMLNLAKVSCSDKFG
jgi:hypothetical protein